MDKPIKTIDAAAITAAVKQLCIDANYTLPCDVADALRRYHREEQWPTARDALGDILENIRISKEDSLPICQDTGMACVFLELGQDVHVVGGFLEEAIHEGVRQGYRDGFLRQSVVKDPLRRANTGDNTPAVIYCRIVGGDSVKITVAPKGFGSENMSRIKMCKPSDGRAGVMDFIVETVKLAGSNPCPPIIVGVGIGGTSDRVALLAKQSLLRPIDEHHPDPYYAEMEAELLERINALGIGPQGFGGKTTAIGVNIEAYPTHIAGLPVAVNISCHVTRHASTVL